MKRSIILLGLTAGAAVALSASAFAQSPSDGLPPIAVQPLGMFTQSGTAGYPKDHVFVASVAPDSVVEIVSVTVQPGGDFGWHSHNATLAVTVSAGTLTLYDTACERQDVTAGQGSLEEAGTVHLARNEGATPATLLVSYLGVPAGSDGDVPQPADFDPCQGLK
jgi:quercetin dioxygenase-like cupin family protein